MSLKLGLVVFSCFCLLAVNSLHAQNTPSSNFGGLLVAPTFSTGGSATGSTYNATFGLATGDFNHDGFPDLAVVTTAGQINVLLNDGKGGMQSPLVSTPGILGNSTGILPSGQVIAADLNGDGYDDLAIGVAMQYTQEALYVLLNRKDGTFSTATPLPVSQYFPYYGYLFYFSLGQTTSSGHTDIVLVEPKSNGVTEYTGSFVITTFVNDGAGNLTSGPQSTLTAPNGTYVGSRESVALADANHDGRLDLFLLYFDNLGNYDVAVALGNGDGSFQTSSPNTASILATNPWVGSLDLAVTDLTGDPSKQDIVIAEPDGVAVALSKGDGTYQTPVLELADPYGFGVKTADVNGDGKPDLLLSQPSTVTVFPGNGDGTFGAVSGIYTADIPNNLIAYTGLPLPASIVAVVDFDGDGHLDFAAADSDTGLAEIARGNGDGTFVATPILTAPAGQEIAASAIIANAVMDLNGDGLDDFVSAGPITALADGNGGFRYTKISFPSFPYALEIRGDFNGDGKEDVVLEGSDNSVAVALSNGDGTLKSPIVVPFEMTLACYIGVGATAGDLNGDGKLDLVIPYSGDAYCNKGSTVSSGFFVALGNGDGTFQPATFTAFGSYVDATALGHFHGNGAPLDLVVGGLNSNPGMGVWIFPGKGDGTFGTPTEINSTQEADQILTDDFNQDGNADVTVVGSSVYGASNPAGVIQLSGNGDGTFATPVLLEPGEYAGSGAYADMNGDGVPDLVLSASDGLSVRLGVGGGSFAPPIPYFSPFYAGPVLVGNFLGDNTQSLLIYGNYIFGLGGGTGFYKNLGGTSLALTSATTSPFYGQSVSLSATLTATISGRAEPSGTVTFYDGPVSVGTGNAPNAALDLDSLAVGTHTLKALYAGDVNFNPNTSRALTVTVSQASTTTSLSASSQNVIQGTSVTFTATVAGASVVGTPTGCVSFMNGSAALGSGALNSSGVATFTTSSLAVGSASITAVYAGDSSYTSSTSSAVTITVTAPPAPTFAVSGTAVTVVAGATAGNTSTITVTPANGFTGAVNLSAALASSPSGALELPTISLAASSLTVAGTSAVTTTAAISTMSATSSSLAYPVPNRWYTGAGGAVLACAAFFAVPRRRRQWLRTAIVAGFVIAFGATGCGGGGSKASLESRHHPGKLRLHDYWSGRSHREDHGHRVGQCHCELGVSPARGGIPVLGFARLSIARFILEFVCRLLFFVQVSTAIYWMGTNSRWRCGLAT